METTAADFNSVSGFMSLIFYIETILAYQQRQANKFLCLPIIFFLQYNIPVSRTMRTKLFTEIFHSHSDIHLFIYFVSWKDTISELKYNMKSMVRNFKLVSLKTKENLFYIILCLFRFIIQVSYEVKNGLHNCRYTIYQHVIPNDGTFQYLWETNVRNPFHSSMNFSRIKLFWCVFLCKKHKSFC